jgi:DNA-binding beta-propeller fold protein YncE
MVPARHSLEPFATLRSAARLLAWALALSAFAPPAAAQPLAYVLLHKSLPGSFEGPQQLLVIDTVTHARVASIPLETGCEGCTLPRGLVATPDGSRLFAVNRVSGTISVVDALARVVVGSLPVGAGAPGYLSWPSLAVSADGSRLYVLNTNIIRVYDANTLAALGTRQIATGPETSDLLISPDGRQLYVLDRSFHRVTIVDPESGRLLASLPVPGSSPPFTLAAMELTADGSNLYVTGTVDGDRQAAVSVFDTATAQLVTTFTGNGWRPRVRPGGAQVWLVGDFGIGIVQRPSHTSAGTVTTLGSTRNVMADFTPDGSKAFVSNVIGVLVMDTESYKFEQIRVGSQEGFTQVVLVAPPPPPPPGPPTDLMVKSMAGVNATFQWRPPASGAAPTDYLLEGGLAPGETLATIPIGSSNTVFTLAAPPGSYYIRMRSVSGSRRSEPSNEVPLHIGTAVRPSAPEGLTALVNGTSLSLTWRNTFRGGRPEAALLDVAGAATTTLPLGAAESFSYPSVPPGTYTFSIRASNAAGASPSSNAVTLTFPGPCTGAPAPPANFLAYRSGSTIVLTWDPAPAGPATTGYAVSVTGSLTGTFAVTTRTISGTVGRGSYALSVAGTNACGQGPATPAQVVVVP